MSELGSVSSIEQPLREYLHGIQLMIESEDHLFAHSLSNAWSGRTRGQYHDILKKFMPVSAVLLEEIEHDKEAGDGIRHEVDHLIHTLRDNGFFSRSTLRAHIVKLENHVRQLSICVQRLQNSKDLKRKDDVRGEVGLIQNKIRAIRSDVEQDFKDALAAVVRLEAIWGSILENDFGDEWKRIVADLEKIHNTSFRNEFVPLQTVIESQRKTLGLLRVFLDEELKNTQKDLHTIDAIAQLLKTADELHPMNDPRHVLERIARRWRTVESVIYQDILPRLFTYEKLGSGEKKIVHLKGELLRKTMFVCRKLQNM